MKEEKIRSWALSILLALATPSIACAADYTGIGTDAKTMTITNVTTGQVLAHKIQDVIASDYNYIAMKEKGQKAYGLYDAKGQKLSDMALDTMEPVSETLALLTINRQTNLYNMQSLSPVTDKAVEEWLIPARKAQIVVGFMQGADGLEEIFYNFNGQEVAAEEAKAAIKRETAKLVKNKPALKAMIHTDDRPIPNQLNHGALTTSEVITPYSEGIAFVKASDNHAYAIDTLGNTLFTVDQYVDVQPYNQGIAYVARKARSFNLGGFLGSLVSIGIGSGSYHNHHYTGVGIGIGNYDPFNDYSWTRTKLKHGYIDKEGKEIISSKLGKVGPITNGAIMIYNKGRYGLVNTYGDTLLPMEYKDMRYLSQQDAYVVKDGKLNKYGIVDRKARVLLDFNYDAIEAINANTFKIKSNNQWQLLDTDSNYTILDTAYDEFESVSDRAKQPQMVAAKSGNEMVMVNLDTGLPYFKFPNATKAVDLIGAKYVTFTTDQGQGILDRDGKVIVPAQQKIAKVFEGIQ